MTGDWVAHVTVLLAMTVWYGHRVGWEGSQLDATCLKVQVSARPTRNWRTRVTPCHKTLTIVPLSSVDRQKAGSMLAHWFFN